MTFARRDIDASETSCEPEVVACSSLREIGLPVGEWLEGLDVACAFAADVYADAERFDPRLLVLPVFTEAHARRLAAFTERHPGTSVLGVITDVTGHHTHRAIQSGASWVLNTLLSAESCVNLLRMLTQAVVPAGRGARPSEPALAGEGEAEGAWRRSHEEQELIELLCGPTPITEIASRFYCSERSMYRQLRLLYAKYGVKGRQEFRREIAHRAQRGRAARR